MKPWVLSQIPEDDLQLFRQIERIVSAFPDVELGKDEKGEEIILSCHLLARGIGKVFGLRHVDGFFYPNYQHSWLLTANGNLIDVYPVGMLGGPIMFPVNDTHSYSPQRWLYKKKRVLRGRSKAPSFGRALRIVVRTVERIRKIDIRASQKKLKVSA